MNLLVCGYAILSLLELVINLPECNRAGKGMTPAGFGPFCNALTSGKELLAAAFVLENGGDFNVRGEERGPQMERGEFAA
jgi:hypothetical protein